MDERTAMLPQLMTPATLCGAKTRAGTSCRCPALKGKTRCKLHGGRSVGFKGAANGNYRHGGQTQEAIALRREASALLSMIGEQANA
ncbi:HGGxSTG domain-containing protein [Blastomonas fulva]|uniref:HGGxSTG domain-containing protein n=1 Tax=Blastomonas fulva TaxID=1550728 RepID=UPI003D6AD300